MRIAALLLALALSAAGEDEPPVREITFRDAVDLGLAYNLGLKTARVDALVARLAVDREEAAWDAAVVTDVSIGETLLPSRSTLAGADVVDTDSFGFALGVTKPFRVGPSLGVTWRTDRTFTNSSFSTINPAYDTALDVSLTVPLLRGRGREAQESLLRASRASALGARHDLEDEAARLVVSISDAYWNLVYLDGQVGVLAKSVEVAREIEAAERRKLEPDIGRSTVLDVTQAEAETKRREVALIKGRLEAGNAADTLRMLILPFTGGPQDEVRLRAAEAARGSVDVPALAELVDTALARRPDLLRSEAELARLREAVVGARDALRLQLDLTTGVVWRGVDGQFGDSSSQTLRGDTPSVSAAVTLTWPVGRRAARAALRRTQLELERGELDRLELVNTIIAEVRRTHRTLRTAVRETEATAEEVRAAAASLEGERKRLERGSSTVIDVSRLEENLTNAQLRQLQAWTGLQQARVAIRQVSGEVLDELEIGFDGELQARRQP